MPCLVSIIAIRLALTCINIGQLWQVISFDFLKLDRHPKTKYLPSCPFANLFALLKSGALINKRNNSNPFFFCLKSCWAFATASATTDRFCIAALNSENRIKRMLAPQDLVSWYVFQLVNNFKFRIAIPSTKIFYETQNF
jgi:hypothetical protein